MASNIAGISSYRQTNQVWKNNQTNKNEKKAYANGTDVGAKTDSGVKVSEWKQVRTSSSLIPTAKEGYGTVIGDVELSEKAKNYYDKLKDKFHGMDFILVSKENKAQVAANAASYGNANKPVVLIDEEKLERMATDEAFRKKYEGIIAMSQTKLQEAKNGLISSGANVKNFGMSVASDGRTSFFATVERANNAQTKALEKRQAAKKETKAREKKKAEKQAREERIGKTREEKKSQNADRTKNGDAAHEEREYLEFSADSVENLIDMVSKYAYDQSARNVRAESESNIGQNFDFKG